MRHIKENRITTITADSENVNYLIANTQDTHPSKPWQALAGARQAVITAEVNYGVTDIAIFGTNAEVGTVVASDPNEMAWGDDDEWGDSDAWANTAFPSPSTVTQYQRATSKALWLQLTNIIDRPAELEITLTAPEGETVYAGIIQASIAETYGGNNPKYGVTITPIDTSISVEMSNGSRYYKKRNVLRQFGLTVLMTDAAAFDAIDFFQEYGAAETPWKITDLDSNEWVVFGHMGIGTSYDYLGRSTANITITEVL